jgi:hypothetical protein
MRFIHTTYIRITATAALIMLIVVGLHAQPAPKEKIESMRVAFITNRLQLTPEQSRDFWPIYNSYRHDLTRLRRSYYPHDDGSDPHLDADRQLEFEQRRLDLKKQYKPQLEQVLGKAKLNRLVGAEEDFKRYLIQTVRNRRQQRPYHPAPGY